MPAADSRVHFYLPVWRALLLDRENVLALFIYVRGDDCIFEVKRLSIEPRNDLSLSGLPARAAMRRRFPKIKFFPVASRARLRTHEVLKSRLRAVVVYGIGPLQAVPGAAEQKITNCAGNSQESKSEPNNTT